MKKVRLFLAVLLVMTLFAGCGSGAPADQSNAPASDQSAATSGPSATSAAGNTDGAKTGWKIAIAGINLDDGMNALTQKPAEGFNTLSKTLLAKKFPGNTFDFIAVPWDGASAKIETLLKSGGADLIAQGGAIIPRYYAGGLIQSLNPFIQQDEANGTWKYAENYPANFRIHPHTLDYSGKETLTLPWQVGYRLIIYDSLLFQQWGVEPLSDNPTPQEILDKAKKMTGKNPVTGEQNYGAWFAGNQLNMSFLVPATEAFGDPGYTGNFAEPQNLRWSLNSSGFVAAMQWGVDLARCVPAAAATGQGNELFGLENNNIGIMIDGDGAKIMGAYNRTGDHSMIDRFIPTMSYGKNGGNWTPVDGMAMNSKLTGADANMAWEILKYVTGSEVVSWYYNNWGPIAVGNLVADKLFDPNDVYLKKNNQVIAQSTNPGFELNPFYGVSIQPVIASMLSRSIAGDKVDVKAEMDALQDKAIAWSAQR